MTKKEKGIYKGNLEGGTEKRGVEETVRELVSCVSYYLVSCEF